MKQMMELDQKEFTRWVEDHPPLKALGISHSACDCPIARYLWETRQAHFYVYPDHCRDGGHASYELPAWATGFIMRIDGGLTKCRRSIFQDEALCALKLLSKESDG